MPSMTGFVSEDEPSSIKVLVGTSCVAGVLIWDSQDKRAFEDLAGSAAPSDVSTAVSLLQGKLATLPAVTATRSAVGILAAVDRKSITAMLDDLVLLSGRKSAEQSKPATRKFR